MLRCADWQLPTFRDSTSVASWHLKMGPTDCLEISLTLNIRYVTSQESEDLIYTAAEAQNHAYKMHDV